jgi:WD40 repeat protein/tetratricopeptide (TPR) repeat protein
MERGDAEAAIEILETASRMFPKESDIQRALAVARDGSGKWISCHKILKGHESGVRCVAISPDSRLGLSGDQDSTMRLWELSTGRCLKILKNGIIGNSVVFSPVGRWILNGSGDKLKLWDLATGKCVRTFEGHTDDVHSVAISRDGRWGLSGSRDKTLRLWELATGECRRRFEGHTAWVHSVAISPDGRWGLSGCSDHTLRLWDLAIGNCVRMFEGHASLVNCVAFSPDGRWILSGSSDKTLRLWELAAGACVRVFKGCEWDVRSVAISPDGRWALSESRDNTPRLWELATGKCVRTLHGHRKIATCVSISPDGRWALSGSDKWPEPLETSDNYTVRLWKLGDMGPLGNIAVARPRTTMEVGRLAKTARTALKNARIALEKGLPADAAAELAKVRQIAGYERNHELMELWRDAGRYGKRCELIEGWNHRTLNICNLTKISTTQDGRCALYGNDPDPKAGNALSVLLVDQISGQAGYAAERVKTLEGHAHMVRSFAISPDGVWGISGSWDKTLRVWDMATGKCARVLEGHEDPVDSVLISRDGRWALSGSYDKTLRLWELATGRCVRVFRGHPKQVCSLAVSPDGRWGLSGSFDGTLRLWELSTGKCVRICEGHIRLVSNIAFSPDGRWALSTSYFTMRQWELATGRCLRILEEHAAPISSIAISPDGRWILATAGSDEMGIWNVDTGECAKRFILRGIGGSFGISPDACWALSVHLDNTILWELVWNYKFPKAADWDEGAQPYLENFLTLHSPGGKECMGGVGKPDWNEADFNQLLKELQDRGYGWLRAEGVRSQLNKISRRWKGPPPIHGFGALPTSVMPAADPGASRVSRQVRSVCQRWLNKLSRNDRPSLHTLEKTPGKARKDEAETWIREGNRLFAAGQLDKALALFDKALEVNPEDVDALGDKARILNRLGKYAEAVAYWERVLKINPGDAQSWCHKGTNLVNLGDFEGAIVSFDRALEINPEFSMPWRLKGGALAKAERMKEAVESFRNFIKYASPHDTAHIKNVKELIVTLGRIKG